LPKGWVTAELREVTELVTSGSRGWAKYYSDAGAAFVRIGNIKRGSVALDWADMQRVRPPPRAEGERTKLQLGDILVTITADLGRVAVFTNPEEEAYINQHVALVRLLHADCADYVAWYLASYDGQLQLLEKDKGTTRAGLGLEDIHSVSLILPPLAEQRRIVAKLGALTARTARARADLDRVPVLAARYKQAVLAKAFSGDLTQGWRGGGEADRATGALPTSWRWEALGGLADTSPRSIQSGPFGSNLLHSEFGLEGRLVIGIDNVQDGQFSLGSNHRIPEKKFHDLERYRARPGDVAITVMGTVGRTCVVPEDIEPAIITKHVYRITLDRRIADPHYLMNALRGSEAVLEQMGANVRGQTRPGINGTILKALQIPLAPIDEQREIVRRINCTFAEIDRLTAEAASARHLLDRLDQAILAKAFRGELVPQDPADEPASALLERIRAERAAAPVKSRRGPPAKAA
jgi:type I restriction enzyme S subunit